MKRNLQHNWRTKINAEFTGLWETLYSLQRFCPSTFCHIIGTLCILDILSILLVHVHIHKSICLCPCLWIWTWTWIYGHMDMDMLPWCRMWQYCFELWLEMFKIKKRNWQAVLDVHSLLTFCLIKRFTLYILSHYMFCPYTFLSH